MELMSRLVIAVVSSTCEWSALQKKSPTARAMHRSQSMLQKFAAALKSLSRLYCSALQKRLSPPQNKEVSDAHLRAVSTLGCTVHWQGF